LGERFDGGGDLGAAARVAGGQGICVIGLVVASAAGYLSAAG